MLQFSNLRIGTKLAITSGIAVLLVCAMVGSQWLNNVKLKSASDEARLQNFISLRVADVKDGTDGMQLAIRDLRLARTAKNFETAKNDLDRHFQIAVKNSDEVIPKFRSAENRERAKKAKDLAEQYYKEAQQIVTMRGEVVQLEAKRAGNKSDTDNVAAQISALTDKVETFARERTLPIASKLDTLANEAADVAEKRVLSELSSFDEVLTWVTRIGFAIGLIAAVVLIGSTFLGIVTIAKPLRALVRPLEDVAGGNFAVEVPGVGRKDEVGQVAAAVSEVVDKVRATIAEIKASGREVTNASAEISTSTTDLSQRTEEQAASLEETSASMEQIAATVKKNAENARQANEFATETNTVAEHGGAVVGDAVTAMARIEESSRKISDIIGVIDEIARQTNLLALNAAVEAARAGEAGRGFAVVASEVRSLAQRSSQAAKDIKDLITNSNSQVKDGVDLVNKAGESLNAIVASIKKVTSIVADIANASMEQSAGIEQINKALTQMDEVTQQNSALVEENAATAKTLEHQARAMDERVAFFQIGDAGEAQYALRAKEPAERPAPKPRAAAPTAKAPVASKHQPVVALKHVAAKGNGSGAVRKMQTAVAAAMNADADWKEF